VIATALVAGSVDASALVLDEPLSFWGGLDPVTGRIIDIRHPQHGECVTGRALVMPAGRGSSSSSTVLAESIRLGTAPAAILLTRADPIIVVGVLVAGDLYGRVVPVLVLPAADHASIMSADHVAAGDDARLSITPHG
jgi:predicted aconitase with swiveling domain